MSELRDKLEKLQAETAPYIPRDPNGHGMIDPAVTDLLTDLVNEVEALREELRTR